MSLGYNQNLERIERLMEQMRSTSSHIAHELRTPLTHLQNRLYNLTERQGLEHEMREELHQAVEEVHKILGLFRTVMRIGEIESGRCVHQFARFEVRPLLEEVSEYYQPLADAHHCQLLIDAPAGTPLFGDRALLFQALANLIENALRVSDRGPGIPDNLHATALERFQRLEGSQQQPGFGLGLSLVKAIAELHGGQLCMASANPGLHVYLCLQPT
ncbi:sensor histidine kinase [Symbiopectobacterium purcellii]|uniref:sensor histidine kinase n=1 Tax=Symbiopectobacterium purcellii TaxID=2871826 RepID=UPI003F833CCD